MNKLILLPVAIFVAASALSSCSSCQNEEKEGTENEIHHILHTDISRIFRPGEARFDHCKSRLHEINQKCAEHGPYNIH